MAPLFFVSWREGPTFPSHPGQEFKRHHDDGQRHGKA